MMCPMNFVKKYQSKNISRYVDISTLFEDKDIELLVESGYDWTDLQKEYKNDKCFNHYVYDDWKELSDAIQDKYIEICFESIEDEEKYSSSGLEGVV